MKALLAYLLSCCLLASCSKNSEASKDVQPPTITMNSPTNNESYSNGQIVHIAGSISDNGTIAEVHIVVSDLGTGAIYVHTHIYPAAATTPFTQDFTATAGVSYKVEIVAIDRALNQGYTSVQVSCN